LKYIADILSSEETELQSELKQVKNQLRGELLIQGSSVLMFNVFPELKDENLKLKDENKSLQEYIDKLLLIVMDTSPDALAVH